MANYGEVISSTVTKALVMPDDISHNDCIAWLNLHVSSNLWIKLSSLKREGTGHTRDNTTGKLTPPRPTHYRSWVIGEDNVWQAPIALPDDVSDDIRYTWDEDVYQADNSAGWVLVEE